MSQPQSYELSLEERFAEQQARIAELEAQLKWDNERQFYLETCRDELEKKLAEATYRSERLERALRLACKYQFDEGLLMPGGKMAKNWQEIEAMFMKQARKEP